MKKVLTLSLLFICHSITAQTTPELAGYWKGHIDLQGQKLTIKTHFTQDNSSYSGTIDIPQQGATGIQLQQIDVTKHDSVFFKFMAGPGNAASFEGVISNDSSITGTFHQNGMRFPFTLSQYSPKPKPTLPYGHKEIIIQKDSLKIGGTLTWPQKIKTEKLVIMISGSGAQDRDATLVPVSTFKPFARLADSLTRSGLATFRYDDRGIGQSSGNFTNTSLEMLASDVEAIIAKFSTGKGQIFDEIILLGHSQGGIVGGKVAAHSELVDKLILMASPGVSLAQTVVEQVELLNKQQSIPDSIVTQKVQLQKAIFDTLRNSQDFSKFDQNIPQNELNYLQSPAYFSLLDYQPTKDLQQLQIPVLVLMGGKDTQVTVQSNKKPIEQALEKAGTSYQITTFEEANHVFQQAKTGSVNEYGELPNKFVKGVSSTISQWIKEER